MALLGMGLAASLARRSLLQRPGRTFFSVMGIAVGIATVVAIFVLDYNTLLGRARGADPEWQAEIEVSPSAAVREPHAELREVPGVTDVAAAFQSEALLERDGAPGAPERIHMVAIEAGRGERMGLYSLQEGRDFVSPRGDETPSHEVVIGEGLARRLELGPGSKIRLGRPGRGPQRECVDGQWRLVEGGFERAPRSQLFEVVGVLTRDGLGRKASGDVALVDFGTGKALFEGAHVETRYWLAKDPTINVERIQSSLGRAWSYDLRRSVIIGQAADERAFRNGVRFAGLLALVLGLYVIFHTLSMSLIERVREVGVLNALGASRRQIARIFLFEAVLIAGAGGILGLAGGLLMAKAMLRVGISTVGTGTRILQFEVPWAEVLPLVAAGVGIALLGSIYPLARARNTDAVSALRGEGGQARGMARAFQAFAALLLVGVLPAIYLGLVPVIGEAQKELIGILMLGLGVLALFIALPLVIPVVLAWACAKLAGPFQRLWPLSGQLASRAMLQGPARVSGAVAGLALVTAGFVGLQGMTRSLEKEIEVWGREAFVDKVYVRNAPRLPFEQVAEHLGRTAGVLGLEPDEARTYVPFLMIGLREQALAGYGPAVADPGLLERLRSERGTILSHRLARHRGYSIGDEVHVQTPKGKVVGLPVLAISDAYGYFPHPDERLYGVVSDETMRELFCVDTATVGSYSVRLGPGADAGVVVQAVRELYPDAPVTVQTGGALWTWFTNDIRRDFVLFDILIALTVLLAGLGVLNGQLLAMLERSKELGVLRALGMSRGQVAGMVLLESALVGLVGGLLGAALGAGLIPVIVRALRVISGLPLPHVGPGAAAAVGAAGAVAVGLLAGLYPIWRMNRSDALAAVRSSG